MSNMTQIEFFAEGIPKGQPRPKAFARNGHAAVYDPGTAEGWKDCIRSAARRHRPAQPLQGPIRMSMQFFMPRPKAHYRTGKHAGVLREDAPHWHIAKPDLDNLQKAVLDALKDIGMFADDAQWCVSGAITKTYASDRHGVMVEIQAA